MPRYKESPSERASADVSPASSGVDFEAAQARGIQVIWALSLPGKTAPVTAGEIVADTVQELLTAAEGGGCDD